MKEINDLGFRVLEEYDHFKDLAELLEHVKVSFERPYNKAYRESNEQTLEDFKKKAYKNDKNPTYKFFMAVDKNTNQIYMFITAKDENGKKLASIKAVIKRTSSGSLGYASSYY